MTAALKRGYIRMLSALCFAVGSITILTFGTACRTFLYEPEVPEKLKELIS